MRFWRSPNIAIVVVMTMARISRATSTSMSEKPRSFRMTARLYRLHARHEAAIRPVAHRIPPRRWRPYSHLQPAARAPLRRNDAAAHRGYRRGALAPAPRRADRQLAAVARRGVGRG